VMSFLDFYLLFQLISVDKPANQGGQIWAKNGSDWPQVGQIREFSYQISVHVGSRICPIWSQSDIFSAQSATPASDDDQMRKCSLDSPAHKKMYTQHVRVVTWLTSLLHYLHLYTQENKTKHPALVTLIKYTNIQAGMSDLTSYWASFGTHLPSLYPGVIDKSKRKVISNSPQIQLHLFSNTHIISVFYFQIKFDMKLWRFKNICMAF